MLMLASFLSEWFVQFVQEVSPLTPLQVHWITNVKRSKKVCWVMTPNLSHVVTDTRVKDKCWPMLLTRFQRVY